MFRASLRSVSDPLREHVCFSCLAQRFGARPRLRQFYSSPSPRANNPRDDSAADTSSRSKDTPEVPSALNKGNILQDGKKNKSPDLSPKPDIKESVARKSKGRRQTEDEEPTASPGEDGEQSSDRATKAKKRSGRNRKIAGRTRKASAKESKKGAKLPKKEKRVKSKEDEETPSQDAAARTASIQSALQVVVTKMESKTTTSKDRESPKILSFITNSVHKKESGIIHSQETAITPLDVEMPPVPQLSFGLERVLFNPGVYHLRDPRSRVFNFDPYLGSIMPVTEFDFDALKEYITSSRDETLRGIASKEKKKYMGSSSSMTSVLSHFHYLLSAWRGIDARTLSQGFPDKLRTFTRLLRAPSAMFLRYQDGAYAIDADKEFDTANILMNLGKSMEKLLTLPKEDFERYRRSHENKISAEEEQAVPEAYHYSTIGDFIMRSQLDAYDPRLPGTGMFDLKTRAVVSIRMDARNFEHGLGYEIKGRFGAFESYEREFFDMIRAAFLKYSLQVRIGRMDGIFVAFHNIERIFGFQYVSLPEMDQTLHGQSDTSLGDAEFRLSIGLWSKILGKATERFPKKSLRLHFETRDAQTPFMYIFAEPVTDDEIHAIQTKNKEEIDAYQRRILNLAPKEGEDSLPSLPVDGKEAPASNSGMDDRLVQSSSDQVESLPQSDSPAASTEYDSSAPPDESFLSEPETESDDNRELLTLTLVVKNKVNGNVVERPIDFKATDKWTVEYELSELKGSRAQSLYVACQKRRQKALAGRGEDETEAANVYIRRLRDIAKQGRAYREEENRIDQERGIVVLNDVA